MRLSSFRVVLLSSQHAPVYGDKRALLFSAEPILCLDRSLHCRGALSVSIARPVVAEQSRLRQQCLRGDVERVRDQPDDPDRRLVQAALDLAQVGVGQPGPLGQLAQGEVRELALAADEGAQRLHLTVPRLRHDYLLLRPIGSRPACGCPIGNTGGVTYGTFTPLASPPT